MNVFLKSPLASLILGVLLALCCSAELASAQRRQSEVERYYSQLAMPRDTASVTAADPRLSSSRNLGDSAAARNTTDSDPSALGTKAVFPLAERDTVSPTETDPRLALGRNLRSSPASRDPATRNTVDSEALTRENKPEFLARHPLVPASRNFVPGAVRRPELVRAQFVRPESKRSKSEPVQMLKPEFEKVAVVKPAFARVEFVKAELIKPRFNQAFDASASSGDGSWETGLSRKRQ